MIQSMQNPCCLCDRMHVNTYRTCLIHAVHCYLEKENIFSEILFVKMSQDFVASARQVLHTFKHTKHKT